MCNDSDVDDDDERLAADVKWEIDGFSGRSSSLVADQRTICGCPPTIGNLFIHSIGVAAASRIVQWLYYFNKTKDYAQRKKNIHR